MFVRGEKILHIEANKTIVAKVFDTYDLHDLNVNVILKMLVDCIFISSGLRK